MLGAGHGTYGRAVYAVVMTGFLLGKIFKACAFDNSSR